MFFHLKLLCKAAFPRVGVNSNLGAHGGKKKPKRSGKGETERWGGLVPIRLNAAARWLRSQFCREVHHCHFLAQNSRYRTIKQAYRDSTEESSIAFSANTTRRKVSKHRSIVLLYVITTVVANRVSLAKSQSPQAISHVCSSPLSDRSGKLPRAPTFLAPSTSRVVSYLACYHIVESIRVSYIGSYV